MLLSDGERIVFWSRTTTLLPVFQYDCCIVYFFFGLFVYTHNFLSFFSALCVCVCVSFVRLNVLSHILLICSPVCSAATKLQPKGNFGGYWLFCLEPLNEIFFLLSLNKNKQLAPTSL